ncbi:hypothetical protein HJC10_27110 [Corallococcus exiguus]|uniref:Uncharacterized protein n=1 Tax=Corallococcus exiguus TaxID=83462 RepID=A0A7X4Y4C2_9BACT|nr:MULTISPECIES: hypothetical protein [Corallococcus]NBC38320.1 hypothetical protein [Corallococcus exiguus]NNB97423.1 hypothetical protein [Corallococcus exiguus]NNC06507.1 hypothetical protein [Corallococcus exiguus]NNC21779.1 hypothetical protein [Corallococcus exiguus]NPC50048.1 hypothetical protein [Corallococcus exiguus]
MLTSSTRVFLVVALLACASAAVVFRRRQNAQGGRGGRISGPKMAWLLYAVFLWFLVCPLVALDASVPMEARVVLGAFAVSMWLRGAAELYMLYVSRNWRPPYGVGHDLGCIALVGAGLVYTGEKWAGVLDGRDVWSLALVGLVLVSLLVEVAYAALFHQAVEGRTTGEDGVWFADAEQARFQRINRLTLALNVPLYGALAVWLMMGMG